MPETKKVEETLSLDEIYEVAFAASECGITKYKITGGEPKTPQPQKAQLSKDTTKSISDTRVALSVPKTEDKDATPVYGLMLIMSSALAALCIFKKRRTE